jgi:hypothetical protein
VLRTILVASLVRLGRIEEARKGARPLLAVSPGFRVRRFRQAGFQDAPWFEAYLQELRQAELPD